MSLIDAAVMRETGFTYMTILRRALCSDGFQQHVAATDLGDIVQALQNTVDWLQCNMGASKDDFVAKRKDLEDVAVASVSHSAGAQVAAKARLKAYCDSCYRRQLMEDELDDSEKATVDQALQSTQEWLSNNPMATMSEVEAKQKKLEGIIEYATL